MTRFYSFLNQIGFNAPDYRGAPMPRWNPSLINEEAIPDKMRAKYCEAGIDYDAEGNVGELEWITQEDFNDDDFEIFIKEVKRCIEYLIKKTGFDEPFVLKVVAECRSGSQWGHNERELTFNDAQPVVKVEDEEGPEVEEEVVELHEDDSSNTYNNDLLPEELRPYFNLRTELNKEYEEDKLASELEDEVGVKVVGVLEMKDDFFDEVDGAEIDGDFWCDDGRAYFGIAEYADVYRWFDKSVEQLLEPFKYADVTYWIEYGDNPRRLEKTVEMSLDEITPLYQQYIDAYPIAEIHSSDDDYSADYNF